MAGTKNNARVALAPFVAGVVSIGWLFSFAIGAIQKNWEPLTVTTPVMLILAGYAFGIKITRATNDNRDDKP